MAFTLPAAALLGIRIAQAIFAIIVLGTIGHVAAWWNNAWHASSPSVFNYMIYTSVWTLLALIFLTVVPMFFASSRAHHHFVLLALEAVTMIFWFAAFVAEAVFLTGRLCYGDVCNSAVAGNVFGAFEWVLFAVTTAFAVLHVNSSRNGALTEKTHISGPHAGMPQRGPARPNIGPHEGV